MNRRDRTSLLLLSLSLAVACSRGGKGASDAGVDPAAPPKLTLEKTRQDLIFSYVDADGRLRDVDAADKVPPERRKQVLVRDLSKSPEELHADKYVFIADLTREEGGAYPYAVLSRYDVDRLVREGDLVPIDDSADDAGVRRVVLYGTSWCGACAQARGWLRQRGIPFVDKDVEKDDGAQREMARKMKRAGMQLGGVPVIDVMGKLVLGFDAGEIERLLKDG